MWQDALPDDEAELALIGTPEGAQGSYERKAWFEEWAGLVEEHGHTTCHIRKCRVTPPAILGNDWS